MAADFKPWAEAASVPASNDRMDIINAFSDWYDHRETDSIINASRRWFESDKNECYDVTPHFPDMKLVIDTDGLVLLLCSFIRQRNPENIEHQEVSR